MRILPEWQTRQIRNSDCLIDRTVICNEDKITGFRYYLFEMVGLCKGSAQKAIFNSAAFVCVFTLVIRIVLVAMMVFGCPVTVVLLIFDARSGEYLAVVVMKYDRVRQHNHIGEQ